jgi:hypothetical protein
MSCVQGIEHEREKTGSLHNLHKKGLTREGATSKAKPGDFGNPANCKSPVALRPHLAVGLPFRVWPTTMLNHDMYRSMLATT